MSETKRALWELWRSAYQYHLVKRVGGMKPPRGALLQVVVEIDDTNEAAEHARDVLVSLPRLGVNDMPITGTLDEVKAKFAALARARGEETP